MTLNDNARTPRRPETEEKRYAEPRYDLFTQRM